MAVIIGTSPPEIDEEITAALTITRADERAVEEGYAVCVERAMRVERFFRMRCKHSKGAWAGKPFLLEDWQFEHIYLPLFGWVHRDTGVRRFRRSYIEIPKKNGKTAMCSGNALYLSEADNEAGAEVYCVAYKRDQAKMCMRGAVNMWHQSPWLRKRMRLNKSSYRLYNEDTFCFIAPLASDGRGEEGHDIHGLIFDELHVQKDRELWDSLEDGGAARRQPMMIAITTAGEDLDSLCYDQHRYVQGLRDGSIDDPRYFGVIYNADDDDDPADPAVWHKANPGLGTIIDVDGFSADYEKAKNTPGGMMNFRRRRLNQWVGGVNEWVPVQQWDKCESDLPPLHDLRGRNAWMGFDLSNTNDLTAVATIVEMPDEKIAAYLKYFAPETVGKRRERNNRGRFLAWSESGHLTLTPGNSTDYAYVRKAILDDIDALGGVRWVGYDPWNATDTANILLAEKVPLIQVRQGFATMSEPTKQMGVRILDETIEHQGCPVTRWCVGNMACKMDEAGNLKPDKKTARDKVDGVVALIIAYACYIQDKLRNQVSRYEEDGVRWF